LFFISSLINNIVDYRVFSAS